MTDWLKECDDKERFYGKPARLIIPTDELRALITDLASVGNGYANYGHTPDCDQLIGHGTLPCDCGLSDRILKAREVLTRRPEIYEQL